MIAYRKHDHVVVLKDEAEWHEDSYEYGAPFHGGPPGIYHHKHHILVEGWEHKDVRVLPLEAQRYIEEMRQKVVDYLNTEFPKWAKVTKNDCVVVKGRSLEEAKKEWPNLALQQ